MLSLSFVAINIGNTRTQVARFDGDHLHSVDVQPNDDLLAIVEAIVTRVREIGADARPPVVIASVNEPVARQIESSVRDQLAGIDIYRIGDDLPIPIGTQLDPETMTGVDRLLNAAAAYAALKQACVVVDVGTAVTVDFVDGHGTFQGGVIAPGARMQLAALHHGTDALPEIKFARPDEAFGRSTAQAMLHGVFHGIRGLVWRITEQYAEAYGAYPLVIATGGDAAMIFESDELIDRIVPDLTLRGIAETVKAGVGDDDDDDSGGRVARTSQRERP